MAMRSLLGTPAQLPHLGLWTVGGAPLATITSSSLKVIGMTSRLWDAHGRKLWLTAGSPKQNHTNKNQEFPPTNGLLILTIVSIKKILNKIPQD